LKQFLIFFQERFIPGLSGERAGFFFGCDSFGKFVRLGVGRGEGADECRNFEPRKFARVLR
jgi:hypothetical protein